MTSRVLRNSHNCTPFLGLWANYKTYSHQNTSYHCRTTWEIRQCFQFVCITRLFLARRWWTSDTLFAEGLDLRLAQKMNYSHPKPLPVTARKTRTRPDTGKMTTELESSVLKLYTLALELWKSTNNYPQHRVANAMLFWSLSVNTVWGHQKQAQLAIGLSGLEPLIVQIFQRNHDI